MLKPLASNLWVAEAPLTMGGFEIGARMTVVRLPDGGLWLHSPIGLTPELRQALDHLGPVAHVLSPGSFHYLHVPELALAYPDAAVYAAPGSASKLAKCSPKLLTDALPQPWAGTLEQLAFAGSRLYDEVVFFHPSGRTLIVTDLCFNIPAESSWYTRLVARAFGILGRPSASRSFFLTIRDRAAVRQSLERILAWDFDRIILSHGAIVETGGREAFRRAFGRVLR
jgi:hypothetical protein